MCTWNNNNRTELERDGFCMAFFVCQSFFSRLFVWNLFWLISMMEVEEKEEENKRENFAFLPDVILANASFFRVLGLISFFLPFLTRSQHKKLFF